MKDLASRLTAFRETYGISQSGLAKELGVPRSTLWRWETGRGKPTYENLEKLIELMEQKEKEQGS